MGVGDVLKRTLVGALLVYDLLACGMMLLELSVAHESRLAPLLRLGHKARDYLLTSALMLPLLVLGGLRLPSLVHRRIIFQASFIDSKQLVYVVPLLLAAVGAVLLLLHLVA
uniref:Uncharacterized protein n=1 Tax=Coccolithus braarudii TaxID=221442 RepID=A0A7S0L4E9_9EUKA